MTSEIQGKTVGSQGNVSQQKSLLNTGSNRQRQITQRMLDYVHNHYSRPMQLGDVAAALQMNASYLSDLFSRTMGISLHQYIQEFRLAQARELLRNPVNRVCEVSCAIGYASPNYFRAVFKHRVGISPTHWRSQACSQPSALP